MNRRIPVVLLVLLASGRARADSMQPPPSPVSQVCRQAIAAAERAHGIPAHLLAAIARVESGRKDPVSGTFNPWPWTINFDGQGSFYDNKTQAVAAAVSMHPHVVRSIDVGCMQISLTHHPNAFLTMDQAFDPIANTEYGAQFLARLFQKTGSWPKAVELYHSATPDLGQDYRLRVYAAWPQEQNLANASQPIPLAGGWASSVNRALLTAPLRQGNPHIIPLAPGMMGAAPPGRTLADYRSAPVRLAFRMP